MKDIDVDPAPQVGDAAARFSGWRVLALAVVAAALSGPGQTIGVSVFIPHLIASLRLSDPHVAGAYMVGTLLGALAMPRIGTWIDRVGVRRAMTAIGLAFGTALVAMSTVWSLVPLAVGFTLIRMFGQGALMLVSTVAVSHWFERRRGMVMGIMTTAVGLLMSLAPVALNAAIDTWGWRTAWIAAAAVIWVVVPSIARLGMIDRPADVGQVPDGAFGAEGAGGPSAARSMTRRQAFGSAAFWVAMAAVATPSMLLTAVNFHQITLLGEAGFTASEAALMFLPQVVGSTAAGLTFGVLTDRIRGGFVLTAAMVLMAVPLGLVAGLGSLSSVVVYAVLVGAAGGAVFTANAALLPRWFGLAHLGSISGVATFVMVASSSLGPLAMSLARASTGSYGTAAAGFIALPAVVGVAALVVRDPAAEAD